MPYYAAVVMPAWLRHVQDHASGSDIGRRLGRGAPTLLALHGSMAKEKLVQLSSSKQ